MASGFKSVRMDSDIRRVITAMMIRENCNESEAIRRLILDGAKAPRPRPVIAQLGQPLDFKKFVALMMQWQQDFQSIRARLAMADPDPKDVQLCASVAKWRKLAEELEPQARLLSATADAIAKALMGLTAEDCAALEETKHVLLALIEERKLDFKKPNLSESHREAALQQIQKYVTALKALAFFGL